MNALPPGTELNGRFQIREPLAQGDFCITYLAHDLSRKDACIVRELFPKGSLRTEVGTAKIAVDHPEFATRLRQEFVREAKAWARLSGKGVLSVRGAFSELGTAFMVRDYASNARTLAEAISNGDRFADNDWETFARELLALLQRAHSLGIRHLDIRPSNIILTADNSPFLVDFGATRLWYIDAIRGQSDWLQSEYSAPECASMLLPRSASTDLYSLGATIRRLRGSDQDGCGSRIDAFIVKATANLNAERPQSCEAALEMLRVGSKESTGETPLEVFVEKSLLLSKFKFEKCECPECLGILERPQALKSGQCPVCRSGRIVLRKLEPNQCPNCQQSPLKLKRNEPLAICPLCKEGHLGRTKAGLFKKSSTLRCGVCEAEFQDDSEGLRIVQEDKLPRKVPPVQPPEKWREYSGRAIEYWHCPACDAQYDHMPDGRWKQVCPPPSLKWNLLLPDEWMRIAAGLNPDAGNSECDTCGADFLLTQDDLTLTYANKDPHDFAAQYLGRLLPREQVGLLAVGKLSPRKGLVCVDCQAEYDFADQESLTLVRSTGPLAGYAGQTHALGSWHRLARGLPLEGELPQFSQDFDDALRRAYETGQVSFKKSNDANLIWRGQARRIRFKNDQKIAEGFMPFTVDSKAITHGGMIGRVRYRLDQLQQIAVRDGLLEIYLPGEAAPIYYEVKPETFQFKIDQFPRSVELHATSLLRRLHYHLSHPSR